MGRLIKKPFIWILKAARMIVGALLSVATIFVLLFTLCIDTLEAES